MLLFSTEGLLASTSSSLDGQLGETHKLVLCASLTKIEPLDLNCFHNSSAASFIG